MREVEVLQTDGKPALLEVQGTQPIKLNGEPITGTNYRGGYKTLEVIAGGKLYSLNAWSYYREVHNQSFLPGL